MKFNPNEEDTKLSNALQLVVHRSDIVGFDCINNNNVVLHRENRTNMHWYMQIYRTLDGEWVQNLLVLTTTSSSVVAIAFGLPAPSLSSVRTPSQNCFALWLPARKHSEFICKHALERNIWEAQRAAAYFTMV